MARIISAALVILWAFVSPFATGPSMNKLARPCTADHASSSCGLKLFGASSLIVSRKPPFKCALSFFVAATYCAPVAYDDDDVVYVA